MKNVIKIRNIFSKYWRLQNAISVESILQYQYKSLVTTVQTGCSGYSGMSLVSLIYLIHCLKAVCRTDSTQFPIPISIVAFNDCISVEI